MPIDGHDAFSGATGVNAQILRLGMEEGAVTWGFKVGSGHTFVFPLSLSLLGPPVVPFYRFLFGGALLEDLVSLSLSLSNSLGHGMQHGRGVGFCMVFREK